MEDNNNNQGFSNQNPEQPLDQTGTPDPKQYETERTYWETDNVEQNQVPVQNTVPVQNFEPSQGATPPETATQFYQFYQQQMDGSTNPMQPSPVQMSQPPKKKSHKKLIAAVIVLVLLLSIAGTAFAFQGPLMNTLALMTKSPADYYAYIEKKAIDNSVDEITPYLNTKKSDVAYQTSVDLTYDRDTVNSLLQTAVGMSMEDLESNLGIPLNSVGIDALIASKDGIVYDSMVLNLNQVDIITVEILMNTIKQELLLRLPELSSAYIKQSLANGEYNPSKYLEQLEQLTPEKNADFLKRYGAIITDSLNEVELSKNEELTVDTLTVNCNKLTVTLDNESMYKMVSAVLEEAKDDEYIINLLPLFELSEADYKDAIKEAEDTLKESLEDATSEEGEAKMVVYVNSNAEIIGRDFIIEEAGSTVASMGYANLSKNNYNEFSLYVKDEDDNTVLEGSGNQTKEDDTYDGTVNFSLNGDALDLPTSIDVDIEYEDVKTVTKDNQLYQYGTYSISSPQAMGGKLVMENDVVDDVQQSKIILQLGSSPLVTLDMKTEYLDDYSIPTITENEVIYDSTQYETYMSTLNIETFISNLSDKLGVDLMNLIGNLAPYFTGEN